MRKSCVTMIFAIVVSLSLFLRAGGQRYDSPRDDESQPDFFTTRVQERREQLRRMWSDPARCIVWSRRHKCYTRKRGFTARKVMFLLDRGLLAPFSLLIDEKVLRVDQALARHTVLRSPSKYLRNLIFSYQFITSIFRVVSSLI